MRSKVGARQLETSSKLVEWTPPTSHLPKANRLETAFSFPMGSVESVTRFGGVVSPLLVFVWDARTNYWGAPSNAWTPSFDPLFGCSFFIDCLWKGFYAVSTLFHVLFVWRLHGLTVAQWNHHGAGRGFGWSIGAGGHLQHELMKASSSTFGESQVQTLLESSWLVELKGAPRRNQTVMCFIRGCNLKKGRSRKTSIREMILPGVQP